MQRSLSILMCVMAFAGSVREALADDPRCVPTFHCVGISWKPDAGSEGKACTVRYREHGADAWREAMPLWFDKRNGEYRGSVVSLQPGTGYSIELAVDDGPTKTVETETWSEHFPVTKVIRLEPGLSTQPLTITEGGSRKGYVLYTTSEDGSSVIDVGNKQQHCVIVKASGVILRGLTLKGASTDAISLRDVQDVVIEDCDISGWGGMQKGFPRNLDSGIRGNGNLARIIIQRNRIRHPRTNANDWTQKGPFERSPYHPWGPQAITWDDNQGNHVIRFNELVTDEEHRFNDSMGGVRNFSRGGFPGPDSDVYGNLVRSCADDGLEIEGGNRNVRIWGNYIDLSMVGIATCVVSEGPVYVFRNVFARSRLAAYPGGNTDAHVTPGHTGKTGINRGYFAKVGETEDSDSGIQYWFHNTVLQPPPPEGRTLTLGACRGIQRVGHSKMITQIVSLNNILHIAHEDGKDVFSEQVSILAGTDSTSNIFDFDLYNGSLREVRPDAEEHGIRGVPVYAAGHGPAGAEQGYCQLASNSPGFDAGKIIPNFNDNFSGNAPDIGAHEAGSDPMVFGLPRHSPLTPPTERPAKDDGPPRGGKLLYQNSLGSADLLKDWVMEGPGQVSFEDGWMIMESPGEKMHHVYWCPEQFPDRFVASWQARNLHPEAGLCIVFFAATGPGGESVLAESLPDRDGTFTQYTKGKIRCYHISYYANAPDEPDREQTNLRKNPGFFLVYEGSEGIPTESREIHAITLVKDAARIRLWVDERKVIDWTDDGKKGGAALTEGRIGFRQMQWTRFCYRDFSVRDLESNSQ